MPSPDDESSIIECAVHGTAQSTYICEHLLHNRKQKWFSEEPRPDNRWPDAWCAASDLIVQEQGEWNDSNSRRLPIKLLCHRCYEVARSEEVDQFISRA